LSVASDFNLHHAADGPRRRSFIWGNSCVDGASLSP
jgi:hypothetical protein